VFCGEIIVIRVRARANRPGEEGKNQREETKREGNLVEGEGCSGEIKSNSPLPRSRGSQSVA